MRKAHRDGDCHGRAGGLPCSSPTSTSTRFIPSSLLVILLLAVAACTELHRLLQVVPHRPEHWWCVGGILAVLLANWPVHSLTSFLGGAGLAKEKFGLDPWQFVTFTFAAVTMAAFAAEMPRYKHSAGVVPRVALAVWFVAYLGLLPSFLIQPASGRRRSTAPVHGDLRAKARRRGRRTSPAASSAGVGINAGHRPEEDVGGLRRRPVRGGRGGGVLNHSISKRHWKGTSLPRFRVLTRSFTAATGRRRASGCRSALAGVLGDLAESLIKRDCRPRMPRTVPGFGGVLDVIDSILFAAPVAYWWLRW